MTTTPIRVDLAELDTHPLLKWTMRDQADALIDMSVAGRSVELWYWESVAVAGRVKRALWKVALTLTPGASTPQEKAEVHWKRTATEEFYPASIIAAGGGPRVFVGWLRYHDTGSSPVTHKWVKTALEVTAEAAPLEP